MHENKTGDTIVLATSNHMDTFWTKQNTHKPIKERGFVCFDVYVELNRNTESRAAFSLVELSIVLVILGLLSAGITAGKNLIRAAELRSVTVEFDTWITATRTFQNKYLALPGDIANAQSFWGTDSGGCPNGSIGDGTCNGNGDGIILTSALGGNIGMENNRYWQHLALAGLIEGIYTGVSGPTNHVHSIPDLNVPSSSLSGAGWTLAYENDGISNHSEGFTINGIYGHHLFIGTPQINHYTMDPAFMPEEAWQIDNKIDDGQPGKGRIVVYNRVACTNGTSISDTSASYLLDDTRTKCALIFRDLF